MKKAFFFSIDAAAGMAVVLIAIAALAMFYTSTSEIETKSFEATKTIASDASIVGFYLGKDYSGINSLFPDLQLKQDIVGSTAKFGFCVQHFVYDPNNTPEQSIPVPKVFCDEK